jgi:hypothetical protein
MSLEDSVTQVFGSYPERTRPPSRLPLYPCPGVRELSCPALLTTAPDSPPVTLKDIQYVYPAGANPA